MRLKELLSHRIFYLKKIVIFKNLFNFLNKINLVFKTLIYLNSMLPEVLSSKVKMMEQKLVV